MYHQCPELSYTPFDLLFVAGNTPTLTITVTQLDGVTLVNLTGATIYLTCKNGPGRAIPGQADPGLFQLSTINGSIVILAQNGLTLGQYVVNFPDGATEDLSPFSEYIWDSKIELGGNLQTVIGGRLILTPAVTQS